jgi:hypothetical protein
MENNLFGPGCPWYDWYEKFGAPNAKWCEERLCTWVNEPANAWSNLAYLIVAVLILVHAKKDKNKNFFHIGITVVLMFLGSFIYHASNNWGTQILDFLGMFFWTNLLINYNLERIGLLKNQSQKLISYLLLNIVAIGILFWFRAQDIFYQNIIAGSSAIIGITELFAQLEYKKRHHHFQSIKYFLLALLSLGCAQICAQIDLHRIYCDPTNHWIQGHAAWHLLAAVGVYLSFIHYQKVGPWVTSKKC